MALLGDSEDMPERDSDEYVPFLEARIATFTDSMKKLELSAKVKDTEDKVFSLFTQYKKLERAMSTDSSPATGQQYAATGGQHAGGGGQHDSGSPPQWASVCDMISQAGGDPGKIHPSAHVEGVQ